MGILDILILLLLAVLIWHGWRKGLISMALKLAGTILVFFLLAHYFSLVRQGLVQKLHLGAALSTILAVILIVALIALIVQIIRLLLEKTLKLMHMSFINSALGALTGFLLGLLAVVTFSILIDAIPPFRNTLSNESRHRVYSAVRVVRSELYSAFKIKERIAAKGKAVTSELKGKQK